MKPFTFCLLPVLGLVPMLVSPVSAAAQTLNIAVGGTFSSIDPHYNNVGPNNVLADHVFSRLVRSDPQLNPEPDLAVSWSAISPTEWEFKLREGVTFTDGTPFTADDVVFTFGRIPTVLNSPSSFNFAVKPVTQIELIDAHTLRFHTANPEPLLPYNLASVRIVSRRNGQDAGTADYNSLKAAIGTGPYRMTEFVVGDHAVLRRNPSWWDRKPAWDTDELPGHRQQRIARRSAAIGRCRCDRSGADPRRAGTSEGCEPVRHRSTRSTADLFICRYPAGADSVRHRP